uniref:Uncharacterized protein n=1 Tax=Aegilops tauschii subsp. strangulata TaxID=200361 RepID=A0A452ZZN3_AEGTS
MVCKPKQKGGLGVPDTKILNTALLLKFLDKFYNHHDVPWVELIWSTYSTSSVTHAAGPCGSFWWRELIPLCRFNAGSPLFLLSSGRISGAGRYSRMPTRELSLMLFMKMPLSSNFSRCTCLVKAYIYQCQFRCARRWPNYTLRLPKLASILWLLMTGGLGTRLLDTTHFFRQFRNPSNGFGGPGSDGANLE